MNETDDEGQAVKGTTPSFLKKALVVIAHGFGLGLLKPAPGTWGSLLGIPLAWGLGRLDHQTAILIWLALFLLGVVACDAAARHFAKKDPGQCVIDEYVAMGLIAILMPLGLFGLLMMFAAFRLFDIWKPWPIKQFEKLPGGWGVMADDVVAALYATGLLWLLLKGIA